MHQKVTNPHPPHPTSTQTNKNKQADTHLHAHAHTHTQEIMTWLGAASEGGAAESCAAGTVAAIAGGALALVFVCGYSGTRVYG